MKQHVRIAVIGGTPFDSSRGAVFFKEMGIQAVSIGLSEDPDEQTALHQYPKKVIARFEEKVKPDQFDYLVLYCNSLSFITDWKVLHPNKIWELKSVYQAIMESAECEKMAILVAERSMKKNLIQLLNQIDFQKHKGIEILVKLPLVKRLEQSTIMQQKALLYDELEVLKTQGYQEVIFACTHFDFPEFDNYMDMKIYQPGLLLLQRFKEAHYGAM